VEPAGLPQFASGRLDQPVQLQHQARLFRGEGLPELGQIVVQLDDSSGLDEERAAGGRTGVHDTLDAPSLVRAQRQAESVAAHDDLVARGPASPAQLGHLLLDLPAHRAFLRGGLPSQAAE
jgi:hypothetical protein